MQSKVSTLAYVHITKANIMFWQSKEQENRAENVQPHLTVAATL